ncbi:MAG: hypothetical protein O7G86_03135, partial [Gammaproteobacteria bacterium]|nr:hypothetical protein [Gammaproteobacteria bacterium]
MMVSEVAGYGVGVGVGSGVTGGVSGSLSGASEELVELLPPHAHKTSKHGMNNVLSRWCMDIIF